MIDIVQYRSRIGNFRQRNCSKGRFTFKQHTKYARNGRTLVGQNIFTACYSVFKLVLILGLLVSGGDKNVRLLNSKACENAHLSQPYSFIETRSVDVCQTKSSYEQWLYASSSERNCSPRARSVDVCQTKPSYEQWLYASSSERNCSPRARSVDVCQTKPSYEQWLYASSSEISTTKYIYQNCSPRARSVDVCQTKSRCEQWQYASSTERKLLEPRLQEPPVIVVNPEDKNFIARYTYGNKRQHGIKLLHWNKGSSHLENKKDEIETLIDKYKPHILGLSEANLHSHHDLNNVQYPDYTLHTCPTINNPQLKVSRVVVYTHSSLVVKLRPDLMNNSISAIWLEVGLPRKSKILVCNVYREWQYLGQGAIPHTQWQPRLKCGKYSLNSGRKLSVRIKR